MKFFDVIFFPFRKLYAFFSSKKVQSAFEEIAEIVPIAERVVRELAVIDPRETTADKIIAEYDKYGIPVLGVINPGPSGFGNALLNLATALVKQQRPCKATSIIQAAIQIALVAVKAKVK